MATKNNDQIYKLINDSRLETKSDIATLALDTKSDIATLTTIVQKLSDRVSENEKTQAISNTKLGTLIAGISILVSGFASIVFDSLRRG